MQTVENIRNQFVNLYNSDEFVTDRTGAKIIELIGASFLANKSSIFGTPNHEFIQRELDWYKSQSLNVNDIPGKTPKIWQQISSNKGLINSNYGWCIWSDENFNQYDNTLNELKSNPDTRRAQMIYTRPSMWIDYNHDDKNDFMCTSSHTYYIRNNKMHVVVQMRSCDSVYGYKNDYAWAKYVLNKLTNDYNHDNDNNIEYGNIIWQVQNLHVYERHFDLIT